MIFFQGGVDGLAADALGLLDLSREGLRKRNQRVFAWRKVMGLPMLIFMGGGYADPIGHTVDAFSDLFIAAAAVADWKAVYKSEKLKKDSNTPSEIKWELNPDIAFDVSTLPQNRRPITVGFAAETEEIIKISEKLEKKRKNKKLDMLIANKVPESFNS